MIASLTPLERKEFLELGPILMGASSKPPDDLLSRHAPEFEPVPRDIQIILERIDGRTISADDVIYIKNFLVNLRQYVSEEQYKWTHRRMAKVLNDLRHEIEEKLRSLRSLQRLLEWVSIARASLVGMVAHLIVVLHQEVFPQKHAENLQANIEKSEHAIAALHLFNAWQEEVIPPPEPWSMSELHV